MKNDEQLHKWINGELDGDELAAFQQRPEYPSLAQLHRMTDQLAVPHFDEEEMLANILAQDKTTTPPPTAKRRQLLPQWVKYAAAAAVLVIGLFALWPAAAGIELQTAMGEQLEGTLPGGSTFRLNAGSQLTYNTDNWETERRIHLSGEAFFEVVKGQPFIVETANGQVEVLGTSFNVWSRKRTLEVKCRTGKVGVAASENATRNDLTPNQMIRITNKTDIKRWETTPNMIASWTEGISKFKEVPLQEIIDELERQFAISIDDRQVNTQQMMSSNFPHGNLEVALKTALPSAISFEITGPNTVVLSLDEN